MKIYKQKKLESHTLSSKKSTIGDTMQFMRIRLNNDVVQNSSFDGILRNVRVSADEVIKQLPRLERRKYTPDVVDAETEEEENAVELGNNEDIVFEGHGKSGFLGFGRTMEGKKAKNLAQIVFSVVRQFGDWKSWNGRVVLLGCRTAPLVKPMAELLKEEFKREINVVGTNKDIIGTMGSEPYVYYQGDVDKNPINFTDSKQVKMAIPNLLETESEAGFVMVSEDIDQMDIQKWIPQLKSFDDEVTTDGDFDIVGLSVSEEDKEEK